MCFSGDVGTHLSSGVVVARKTHWCDECHGAIGARERYHRHVSLYDGRVDTLRFCLPCDALHNAIHAHEIAEGCGWDESWCPVGEARDYLQERALRFDVETSRLVPTEVA